MSVARASSQPAGSLLEGFGEAMDALLGRAFPESQIEALRCDGCGRDDSMLTESIAGTWACIDCIGDSAYDDGGDRR